MRTRLVLPLTLVVLAAAGAVVLASPPVRAFMQFNRVRYLMNDHQYARALLEWERLRDRYAELAERHPGFAEQLFAEAGEFHLQLAPYATPEQLAERERLLELARERERLAPLARRLELRLSLQGGTRATTATLPIAREILRREPEDVEALWWAVRAQYDGRRPLELPADLLEHRALVDAASGDGAPRSAEAMRRLYLRALVDLHDGDWAHAAKVLEVCRQKFDWTATDDLPLALACLRAGRPDAAILALRTFLDQHPNDGEAMELLLEARVQLRQWAEAAAVYDRIRQALGPQAADGALTAAMPGGGTAARDLWRVVAAVADAGGEMLDLAGDQARVLAEESDLDAQTCLTLLEWLVRSGQSDLARRLVERRRETGGVPAAATLEALAALFAGGEAQDGALAVQTVNQLLTRDSTIHLTLNVPARASAIVVEADSYGTRNRPIVHIESRGA